VSGVWVSHRFIDIITETRTFSSARVTENSLMKVKAAQYTDVNTTALDLLKFRSPSTEAIKMNSQKQIQVQHIYKVSSVV